MAVPATGLISAPIANVEAMLSNCATWQTWTGAASAAEALNNIIVFGFDPPEDILAKGGIFGAINHPIAIIGTAAENLFVGSSNSATGAADVYTGIGSLVVQITDAIAIDEHPSYRDFTYTFGNKAGAVFAELIALSHGTNQKFKDVAISKGPFFLDPNYRDGAVQGMRIEFEFTWDGFTGGAS